MSNRITIFDTTLRDGEQSPGATMTAAEKLTVARALARVGVDVIEAGFPAASPEDFAAVRQIALEVGAEANGPSICGLARANSGDIEKAWRAISGAAKPRIHTFLATSPIHREAKLKMTKAQVLERIEEQVGYAHSMCKDIEFSPEDAGRTEPEFLYEAVRTAIAAGASTINIPDTVGYTQPAEFGRIISGILDHVPSARDIVISVHCHNDLGLAVANTLAGLKAGARQAEVTINGVGERAGNTAMEEVIMALEVRKDVYGFEHGIQTKEFWSASRLVSEVTGLEVQPNKAVVGKNAFAHEAGIHQDGMIKSQETYEIMRPETVGAPRTELVMGKHSGRRALQARLRDLGFELEGESLNHTFGRFKALADRRKNVTDADLVALMRDEVEQAQELYTLDRLQVSSGSEGVTTATVTIRDPENVQHTLAAVGAGPVEAAFNAIDGMMQTGCVLTEYVIRSTNEGKDSLGEATVKLKSPDGRVFRGFGTDQNVLIASARAYLSAQNRGLVSPQTQSVKKVGQSS